MARTSSPYHHGNLRAALVRAAVDATRASGHEALSLRDLARRVGVSHNAAYNHFEDRAQLVAVVAEEALGQLAIAIERETAAVRAADHVTAARQRLAGIGRAYVEYATREPELFKLAFTASSAMHADRGISRRAYVLLGLALDELVDVGYLSPRHRLGAEELCWSAVHGFAMLVMAQQIPAGTTDDRLRRLLVSIDRSLGAGELPALEIEKSESPSHRSVRGKEADHHG